MILFAKISLTFLSTLETSSAILFGVKVMQLFSNYTENLDTLVILLGQICQIQNDFSSLQLNKVNVKTFY
jgi:hypothetical protein